MRKEFVEVKTRKAAFEACPWASEVIKVVGGYWCFESWTDVQVHKNQK